MARMQEIILREGRAYRRSIEEQCIGWTEQLLEDYIADNAPSALYSFKLSNGVQISMNATKIIVMGEVSGFDFSCKFTCLRVDDGDVFFIPTKTGGVETTLPWVPPQDAKCVAGYMFDRIKGFFELAFMYLLPKERPEENVEVHNLMRVAPLTNIWRSGEICLGHHPDNKPALNKLNFYEFEEDFKHRMSIIPWNMDLFPDSSVNILQNRWNARGEKVPYELKNCVLASDYNLRVLQAVSDFWSG